MGLFPEFDALKKELARDKDRLFDLLADIKRNTSIDLVKAKGIPVRITADASALLTNFLLTKTNSPYMKFVGVVGSNDDVILNPALLTSSIFVRIGSTSGQPLYLRPNETFFTGADSMHPVEIYISTGITIASNNWLFLQLENSEDFEIGPFNFVRNTGGSLRLIKWASVDDNTDQFVLFRTPPTVNLGAAPNNLVEITSDGTNVGKVLSGSPPLDADFAQETIPKLHLWTGTSWIRAKSDSGGNLNTSITNSVLVVDDRIGSEYGSTATAAAGSPVTLTLAPIAGNIRLNWVHIQAYSTAARTGGATPVNVTISGFVDNGATARTMQFRFSTAAAIGTIEEKLIQGGMLWDGAASTNVVISCPATTSVIWQVNVAYRDN